jgi:cytochrome d ubiquinol oxidase subunit II
MMNSIAPFWDGNETWLVLGGGGLFAAFPLAYAILMPAFYIPIILMLLGLIFRGVAFEFRFKATGKSRRIWDYSFHFGSLVATFMQGVVLGTFVHGIAVDGRNFAGGAFGLAERLQHHDRCCPGDRLCLAGRHLDDHENRGRDPGVGPQICPVRHAVRGLVHGAGQFGHAHDEQRYQSAVVQPAQFLLPAAHADPLGGFLHHALAGPAHRAEFRPFLLTLGIFLMNYIGIGVSTWPWLVPFEVTLWDAAAAPESQSLLLMGTVFLLPCVLAYTGYCFWVFRARPPTNMMRLTEKQRQWLWFAGLFLGGMLAMLVLAGIVRLMLGMGHKRMMVAFKSQQIAAEPSVNPLWRADQGDIPVYTIQALEAVSPAS